MLWRWAINMAAREQQLHSRITSRTQFPWNRDGRDRIPLQQWILMNRRNRMQRKWMHRPVSGRTATCDSKGEMSPRRLEWNFIWFAYRRHFRCPGWKSIFELVMHSELTHSAVCSQTAQLALSRADNSTNTWGEVISSMQSSVESVQLLQSMARTKRRMGSDGSLNQCPVSGVSLSAFSFCEHQATWNPRDPTRYRTLRNSTEKESLSSHTLP